MSAGLRSNLEVLAIKEVRTEIKRPTYGRFDD